MNPDPINRPYLKAPSRTIRLGEELPRNMELAPGTITIISPSGRKRVYRLSEPTRDNYTNGGHR